MVTIKEIRETFREMLQEYETKQEGMFTKHEKSVLDLILGHQALLKQRLDQLCDSLTSMKTDVEELKESLSFTQKDIDQRFSKKMKRYRVWKRNSVQQKRTFVLYKRQNQRGHWKLAEN